MLSKAWSFIAQVVFFLFSCQSSAPSKATPTPIPQQELWPQGWEHPRKVPPAAALSAFRTLSTIYKEKMTLIPEDLGDLQINTP